MDKEYDVIVLGKGLKECILSGLLTSQWMVSRYCIWIGMTTMEESPPLLISTRYNYIHVCCYLEREGGRERQSVQAIQALSVGHLSCLYLALWSFTKSGFPSSFFVKKFGSFCSVYKLPLVDTVFTPC
ncbi:hypothetical protein ACE6H2_020918 [Prunus campanulata]